MHTLPSRDWIGVFEICLSQHKYEQLCLINYSNPRLHQCHHAAHHTETDRLETRKRIQIILFLVISDEQLLILPSV
jgi:hypothetical protein